MVGDRFTYSEIGKKEMKVVKLLSVLRMNRNHAVWIGVLGLLLLLLRAWPRLMHPEVWDEDGTRNLAGFLTFGFADVGNTVNGYLILVPKLLTMLAASVSITFYPLTSTILAWAVTLIVFVFIAKAPIRLKGGVLLAVACMLIPSDPENFGLPLYTFWWSALLLFVLVFWDENSSDQWSRALIIFLASLSSPVCLTTLPLFWARAVMFKNRSTELKLAVFASICAGIQLWAMWPIAKGGQLDLLTLPQIIPVFLGSYAVGNILPDFRWVLGWLTLAYIAVAVARNKSSWVLWVLVYLWVVSVLMSITRVDISIIHPALAGPRYFFFPFIVLSWLLLQFMISDKSWWIRGGAVALLALGVVNSYPVLDRKHDALDWRGHVYSCPQFSEYRLPVHSDGNAALAWSLPMKGKECADLLSRDFFASSAIEKTYPYRVIGAATDINLKNVNIPDISAVINNGWSGRDYYSITSRTMTLPSSYEIIGSFLTSNAEAGVLTFHMRRGQQILYRSEPKSKKQRIVIEGGNNRFYDTLPGTSEWVVLDFSNRLLPDEFNVQFVDGGDGWGEWSAIALRRHN
jgi:hypothetical protein